MFCYICFTVTVTGIVYHETGIVLLKVFKTKKEFVVNCRFWRRNVGTLLNFKSWVLLISGLIWHSTIGLISISSIYIHNASLSLCWKVVSYICLRHHYSFDIWDVYILVSLCQLKLWDFFFFICFLLQLWKGWWIGIFCWSERAIWDCSSPLYSGVLLSSFLPFFSFPVPFYS